MPLTLGQKIRKLRQELGLSQQQIAGGQVTRAFISLVEQDRCQPSTQTLAVIARQLGKPVEYFLDTGGHEEAEAIELLLAAARRAQERGEGPAAIRNALGALRLTQKLADPAMERRARWLLADLYLDNGRYEDAYEQYEEVLDLAKAGGDRAAMAQAYFRLGHCAARAEDFGTAQRQLQRCLRLSDGKKSLQELRCKGFINLGSCFHRMGKHQEALTAYERALVVAEEYHLRQYQWMAADGVGICLTRLGDLSKSEAFLRRALAGARERSEPGLAGVMYNLAYALLELGRLEEARALLEEALHLHRQRGDTQGQARVMDNLACYWFRRGDLDRAEACCEEGLHLLDLQDEAFIRGTIYRELGRIYKARGDGKRAREVFRLSLEFFRRLKCVDEMMRTVTEMDEDVTPAVSSEAVS